MSAFNFIFCCPYCGKYVPDMDSFRFAIEATQPQEVVEGIDTMMKQDENACVFLRFDIHGCFECNGSEYQHRVKALIDIVTDYDVFD